MIGVLVFDVGDDVLYSVRWLLGLCWLCNGIGL